MNRPYLDDRLSVFFLVISMTLAACSSPTAEEIPDSLTAEDYEREVVKRGLDPNEIDIELMMEMRSLESFPGGSSSYQGWQIEALIKDFPDKFAPSIVSAVSNGTYRSSHSKLMYLEPPFADQEACFDMRYQYYDSQFCGCVRFPASCYPQQPPGGGGGDDEDPDCPTVTRDDIYFRYTSGFDDIRVSHEHETVQWNTFSETFANVALISSECIDYNIVSSSAFVEGSVYRFTAGNHRVPVSSKTDNQTSSTKITAGVQLWGYLDSIGNTGIEQSGKHSATVNLRNGQSKSIQNNTSNDYTSW